MAPNYISNPRTLLSIREVDCDSPVAESPDPRCWAQRSANANPTAVLTRCVRALEKKPASRVAWPSTTHHAYLEPAASFSSQVAGPSCQQAQTRHGSRWARRPRDQ